MRALRRNLLLYFALIRAGLQGRLNYRGDMLVMIVATLLTQGVGYIFLWVVFQQMPVVAGWSLPEVVCVYAMIFITEGFVSIFCEGLWGFSWVKHRGDFDAVLVRPASPLLQVITGSVGINGFVNIGLGLALVASAMSRVSVEWTPMRLLVALGLFASAVLTRLGTVLVSSVFGFWIDSPFNPLLPAVHNCSQFARFPLAVYGRALNLLLTFVIPFGFVSYYPVAWVFGKADVGWIGLFTPLVAALLILVGRSLFYRGLNRYEASGN